MNGFPPNEAGRAGGRAAARSDGGARTFRKVPPGVVVVEDEHWAASKPHSPACRTLPSGDNIKLFL